MGEDGEPGEGQFRVRLWGERWRRVRRRARETAAEWTEESRVNVWEGRRRRSPPWPPSERKRREREMAEAARERAGVRSSSANWYCSSSSCGGFLDLALAVV